MARSCTAWTSMIDQLRDWEYQDDMPHRVAVQEHHLEAHKIPAATMEAAAVGLRMLYTTAIPAT
eukprot:4377072-Amphidinium_carterae.2